MLLTAYLGSLISPRVRSCEFEISESDGIVFDEILLAFTGYLWSQLAAAAVQTTSSRREFALFLKGKQRRWRRNFALANRPNFMDISLRHEHLPPHISPALPRVAAPIASHPRSGHGPALGRSSLRSGRQTRGKSLSKHKQAF